MLWQKNSFEHSAVSEAFRAMGYKYTEATLGVTNVNPR